MPESCQWLRQQQAFEDWVANNPSSPGLLWITGDPGSGKSTLASYVIALFKNNTLPGTCHYHFFLAADRAKRTVSYLLRSIALQVALSDEEFCSRLLQLYVDTGITFSQAKDTIIWDKIFEGVLFRLPDQGPSFWVFDGLDEAESCTELMRFLSRIGLLTRINVLLVSRATKNLLKDVNDYLPKMVHKVISTDDTKADIESYISSSIQKISLNSRTQKDIIQDICDKASGSFLWVKLALDRIRENWHTKEDIRAALTEIPEGMEPLYNRMIKIIASQPPRTREMAVRILMWVACSFRPLEVAELEAALQPEFGDFNDLKHTVEEVCGHFVIIKKSEVALIHQTARQFLLHKTTELPIKVAERQGHEKIADVCITFLSDPSKWRQVFSTIQTYQQLHPSLSGRLVFKDYPFLYFALSSWAYHVSLAPVDSDDLLQTVLTFLERHCLLWINGVALSKRLRILTQAAQHLKTYVKRRARAVSKRPPSSLALTRDSEMRQWANDLIHIVGRFGNNIVESPSSIHKYVVPFCPKDSIISRSFCFKSHSTFSVTGMSMTTWDDCLARLTMGENQTAFRLLCKDAFFVTLVGLKGSLIVWHSETCEEERRFSHGEYVTHIASSKTSNLIATAGSKTIKTWDITSGKEIHRLLKDRHHYTRALAFTAKDSELLIAYDNCSVKCIDLATGQENWQFVPKEPGYQDWGCARYIAFSPDLTQIAIVFRGRPVFVETIQHSSTAYIPPKRCIRSEDRMRSGTEGDVWNVPELTLWHPVNNSVLIMYEDTKIVHWDVADDEQRQFGHMEARAMVLSPDGNLLLTSDASGTLSIWMVPECQYLVYRLKYDELVMDLAFSPDGTRFYDIRGTFCNIWEPEALLRPNDQDQEDTSSMYDTVASGPVIANEDATCVQISALICDSSGKFYCCGKEDGTVLMYDILGARKVRKIISYSSSVAVIKLAWSTSKRYLASADDSGRLIAKRLGPPTAGRDRWAVFPLLDMRVDDAVQHLLFSAHDEYLLISGSTTARVMSLQSKKEICRIGHPLRKEGVWLNHPTDPAVLIRVDVSQERQYLWKTLTTKSETLSFSSEAVHLAESSHIIHRTVQIRGHSLILEVLASVGHNDMGVQNRRIEVIDLHKLQRPAFGEDSRRQKIEGFAKHVRCLIGCFQDRVVFVDHQFWVCTWETEPAYSKHKRHFFLPKDWLSPMALKLIVLNKQGTLLCPKNGEVAIVQSGLTN